MVIAAGEIAGEVAVGIVNDLLDEPDETVALTVTSVDEATLSGAVATGTILDDDEPPEVSIADAVVDEGDAGTIGRSTRSSR